MKTSRTILQLCILLGVAGIALLLPSCIEREDDYISKYCPGSCTIIKGRISTDNGSVPVVGAKLRVHWDKHYYLSGGTTRNKAVATTDEDGNYELRFLLRDDELLEGDIEITADFDRDKYISCQPMYYLPSGSLSRDTTIIQNYTIAPRAGIAISLTPPEQLQPAEEVWATFKYKLSPADPDSCTVIWNAKEGYGDYITVPASTPLAVHVEKIKAGVTSIKKEILTLQPGETKTYEITF